MKLVIERSNEGESRFRLWGRRSDANSIPGQAIEKDISRFAGTVELWRSTPRLPRSEAPLGRGLNELRRRIVESGEPLLSSWEEVDRELGERRSGLDS